MGTFSANQPAKQLHEISHQSLLFLKMKLFYQFLLTCRFVCTLTCSLLGEFAGKSSLLNPWVGEKLSHEHRE